MHIGTDAKNEAALSLLEGFVNARPGFDPKNYGTGPDSVRAYRADYRKSLRALHDYRVIRGEVDRQAELGNIPYALLKSAFRRAFGGRLELRTDPLGVPSELHYTAGGYLPIEYRQAACAVLADLLWQIEGRQWAFAEPRSGDKLRKVMSDRLGRGVARRYFG